MALSLFDSAALMPQVWLNHSPTTYYVFNPAITCFQGQHLLSYRVVTADGRRRLALCRLTPTLQVVPESVTPFSDTLAMGGEWHADPRFCSFRERLYIHYNDGSGQKPNHIYLVEVDPATLTARGPARELVLAGSRHKVEKNWMLFAHGDDLWAIYSISPHIVLRVELGESGPVICRPAYCHDWNVTPYQKQFGEPRGGAPPVQVGDQYVSFFHSSFRVRPLRRLLLRLQQKPRDKTLRYVGSLYGFAAEPPFTPLWMRTSPVLLPPSLPRRRHPQLDRRVEHSAYPGGLLLEDGHWIVAFGAQEEYCCLGQFDAAQMIAKK
jgi:hypothetical protein